MNKSENIQANRTEDGGLPPRQRHMVLGIMMAGTTAACISQSMMIAALPTIMQEFLVGAGLAQLITTAYIFTLGLFSAMSAYLVSKLDARRLFFIAMVGFIVGCCASLFATNYPVLLASRLVQAIGAGILLPLIQVVALSVYPKSQYGKAMGIVGIIIGFAPAIGPAISGFIVDAWGWRAVFVALGVVSAVVTLLAIPFLPNVMRKPATHQHFDTPSAVLFSFGAICLLVATACIEQSGWGVVAAASITLGAVLLFTFARRQLRIPNPLLKLSCFANRQFMVGLALVLLGNLSFMAASIMVPLGFLNPITGRLLDSRGPWPLLVAGCALLLGGTLAFVACDAETPLWVVTVLYGVRICGVACLQMPMTAYASKQLSGDDVAQGTAIITSIRQISSALLSSVLIGIMALASSGDLGIDAHGFGVAFSILAALTIAGFVFGVVFLPKRRKASGRR